LGNSYYHFKKPFKIFPIESDKSLGGSQLKKILIALLILGLLIQPGLAKNTTVIFNFPDGTSQDIEELASLPEDANAFHAFVTVAEEKGLEMNMTYYPDFDSWFVNGINGVENTAEQYWHFWVNNEMSMVGMGAVIPENQDIIELGFADEPLGPQNSVAENAVSWLVENQQEDGEIGNHKVWGNAFGLIALTLFQENDTAKGLASDYLLGNQGEDAGFGYPDFGSDALHTAAVIMAMIANQTEIPEVDNTSAMDFLLSKQEIDGGFSGWGQSDVDTTSWAMMALAAANQGMPSKNDSTPLDFLALAQNGDGGFGYQTGQESSEDYTAEALIAMSAAGQTTGQATENALTWLKDMQGQDGCYSNAYTTALATITLTAFEEDTSNAMQCLEGMQLSDNGFGRDGETSNAVDTALAVIALSGNKLPTKILEGEENPELVAVGSIVKFTVEIRNTGEISAKNVSIGLQGIPFSWIQQQTSETSIAEIEPGETVQIEIYVEMQEVGNLNVFATVSGEGVSGTTNSNMISFEVAAADLDVSLSMQG
jgi:hypothetical protein